MTFSNKPFWPPHAFRFGGGGSGASQVAATPVPVASPPVTTSNAEVVQAQQDLRRQALKKRGFTSTIKAGDTGGWMNTDANPSPGNTKGYDSFIRGATPGPGAKTLGSN